ncbi:hypothetical protein ALC62_12867 [Cyphomyrmex costatus]|uniref:Uncharacterized protein n=1 Tax=Cyphomyrmex costatus TaxID=456900 RepID=A0A195C787_9HYME|nr:hypothetical protein ALC62_12867 [Cyphomyrmex costatus]
MRASIDLSAPLSCRVKLTSPKRGQKEMIPQESRYLGRNLRSIVVTFNMEFCNLQLVSLLYNNWISQINDSLSNHVDSERFTFPR